MAVFRLRIDDPFPTELQGGAVAIGNFDGVHRGHAALMAALRNQGRPAVAVTFDPHPLRLLAPEKFLPQLTTAEDRAELLQAAGADHVVIMQTDRDLLQLEAEEFLVRLIGQRLHAQAVVEGFNFGFGKDRRGTTALLGDWCRRQGIRCSIVSACLDDDGQPFSSSRVRAALDRGDVATAAKLLGRPYCLQGMVIAGEKRGASLGFPTANLGECGSLIPGDGVYAVRVGEYDGAANVGPNPTFDNHERKVEVHLIDFTGDLYGQPLAIDFVDRLRETRQFGSKDELVQQLKGDVDNARRVLAACPLTPTLSPAKPGEREKEKTVVPYTSVGIAGDEVFSSPSPPGFAGGEGGVRGDHLAARVANILREHVAPALDLDATTIEVLGVEAGVARVRIGQCSSCPATLMTLIMGIEQELRKHLPEIEYLEAAP